MRLFGQIMLVCLLIAALQAVIAMGLLLLLVWGLLKYPKETVGLIGLGLFLKVLATHPAVTIGVTALLAVIVLIVGAKAGNPSDRQAPVALLPPPAGPDAQANPDP